MGKKSYSPQRGGIFVEARVAAAAPQGVLYFSALRESCSLERNWPIGQRDVAPRWGADPREPLSTNMPPPLGVERIFTHLREVGDRSFQPTTEMRPGLPNPPTGRLGIVHSCLQARCGRGSPIPQPAEDGKKIIFTPAGWHICRSACCGSRTPAGCYIFLR
jgi:hypothetical protein